MKLMIWWGFALLALLWTGGAWVVSGLLHMGVGLVDSAHAAELGQTVAGLEIPVWLLRWFDIGTIHAALDGIVWTLDTMRRAWPWIGALLQWLVPVIWVLWGLGLVLLLLLAGGAHALARRFGSPTLAQGGAVQ